MTKKYEEDFYGWTVNTAQLLREKRMSELDFENIIEEIEALGRSEKSQLMNRLSIIISYLLKWKYLPNMRSHNWEYTLQGQRTQAKMLLRDNPSLKDEVDEILVDAYDIAVLKATKETGLDEATFPEKCLYAFDQIMDDDFYLEL